MKLLIFFVTMLMTLIASAYVAPQYRDLKLATQVLLEKQSFGSPIAASGTLVKSAYAGPTSTAAVTLTSFTTQPDVPRNIVITPGGTTGDIEACTIVVTGTNFYGATITENFAFLADASSAVTGNKAFKTVTSVLWPANCESGGFAATWSIGVGEKIGLKSCMAAAGDWAWSTVAGAYESTRATIAASSSAVESNTADFNGTMNGSNAFVGYYIQNFLCKP